MEVPSIASLNSSYANRTWSDEFQDLIAKVREVVFSMMFFIGATSLSIGYFLGVAAGVSSAGLSGVVFALVDKRDERVNFARRVALGSETSQIVDSGVQSSPGEDAEKSGLVVESVTGEPSVQGGVVSSAAQVESRRGNPQRHYAPNCRLALQASSGGTEVRKREYTKTRGAIEEGFTLSFGSGAVFIDHDLHSKMLSGSLPSVSGHKGRSLKTVVKVTTNSFCSEAKEVCFFRGDPPLVGLFSKDAPILPRCDEGKRGVIEDLCRRSNLSFALEKKPEMQLWQTIEVPYVQVFRETEDQGLYFHHPFLMHLAFAFSGSEVTTTGCRESVRSFLSFGKGSGVQSIIITPPGAIKDPLPFVRVVLGLLKEEFNGIFRDVTFCLVGAQRESHDAIELLLRPDDVSVVSTTSHL